ncbi:hypothetical protein ACHAXN_002559 [Cyclotella atomus]
MSNPKPNQSGRAWPAALRRELGMPDPSKKTSDDEDASSLSTRPIPIQQRTAIHSSNAPTPNQLRQYIHRSYAAITSLQRQIYRGEESYFEDSYGHGNIFLGWDNIWIEAGSENGTNAGGDIQMHKTPSLKKMPNDHRWFSTSCKIDPKGDGKVEAILSRGSLVEPPQSATPVKASNGETSGRVLKRSSPLKVSPGSTKPVAIKTEISHTTSSPAAKKAKPNDEIAKTAPHVTSTKVVADKSAFNTQQISSDTPSSSAPVPVTSLSNSSTATIEGTTQNPRAKPDALPSHAKPEAVSSSSAAAKDTTKVTSQENPDTIDFEMKDVTTNATASEHLIHHQDAAPAIKTEVLPDKSTSNPTRHGVSTSLQDKLVSDTVETKVRTSTSQEQVTICSEKQNQDTMEALQAANSFTKNASTSHQPNEDASTLKMTHKLESTASSQVVDKTEVPFKDEKKTKPVAEKSIRKSDPVVATESKQSNTSVGTTAAGAKSDSEEDVPLSQIVKMRSKATPKAQTAIHETGGQPGTRMSSRRRKQSH